MISFVAFGSWGEIAPLLEIALQFRDEEVPTQFMTTPEWVESVEAYGIKCHAIGRIVTHRDSLQEFLEARVCGQIVSLADEIEQAAKGSVLIIGSIFVWSAAIAAKRLKIPYQATTTTPIYHQETAPVEAFRRCVAEYYELTREFIPTEAICLSPWFFNDGRLPCPGYPLLREIGHMDEIEGDYAVISCGTIVSVDRLTEMVDAVRALGLKSVYLGRLECDADVCLSFDVRRSARKILQGAKVCITHAGVGTTLDALGVPMVVSPVAYDQPYNARKLVEHGAAVMMGEDIAASLREAMQLKPYLLSNWSLRGFARLL